jgi:hypothetical protein
MECPNCKSHNVRRSQRRGLYEGVILRIASRAPFRCESCRLRFRAFSPHHRFHRHGAHRSLASFLGFPRTQQSRFERTLVFIFVGILAILFGIWLATWLARQDRPIPSTRLPLFSAPLAGIPARHSRSQNVSPKAPRHENNHYRGKSIAM